ncbi:Putative ribonuclease H protein [Dendrobium catenatum]|uniref:Ribonuclease H protein n=1 Tax=Dendrobium catenatum TaxID=906689 RepID=A0A2I0W1S6_9ASPA|nr:Putative ribonuclease H protein [Dendrobium catenatum]
MPLIVKENQAGFIKNRTFTDHIILAQEILTYATKGKKNFFCAKFDIRKAFDTISREFILARLLQKGFPPLFITWIKSCISNVNYSIVIKGALQGYFSSSAGLRQGCPLSPYLFCIAMDAFSSILDDNLFEGAYFKDFRISHLLYADDLLVFGDATCSNCTKLMETINRFTKASGLHINLGKSSLLLPKHLTTATDICNSLPLSLKDSISYPEIPISFRKLNYSDISSLTDDITGKLSGWNAKMLSFAGRLQYLKFTMLNSITYWIRGAILNKGAFKFFRKMASKFMFFGDISVGKKLHLVRRDNVCKPKDKGGLGIYSIYALQHGFNCSLIHRMYNRTSPLASWLFRYYSSPWKPPHSKASKFWKSICSTAATSKDLWEFKVTLNSPLSFIWDSGCNSKCLVDLNPEYANYEDLNVSNFISSDGCWNIPINLPIMVSNAILGVSIMDNNSECLSLANKAKANFKSFTNDFYKSFPDCNWEKFIWHSKHSLRYSIYAWLSLVGGLKTAMELYRRNIVVDLTYSLCFNHSESTNHLFFDCNYSHNIITNLIPELASMLLRPNLMQIFDWVNENQNLSTQTKRLYFIIICCTVYHVWRERNERKFALTASSTTTILIKIKKVILCKVSKWCDGDLLEKLAV